ncbi:MAG TPA: RDD family protein [Candidatus Binatia bacterium]
MDPSDAGALYPSIPARIKAGEIDVLLLTAVNIALVAAYLFIGYRTPLIVVLFVAVILLYEPLLVSYRGATVGHRLMGFKIIDGTTKQPLSVPRSFARFWLKTVLGIVSIAMAYFDKREQFLHDRITGSRAILADVALDRLDFSEERFVAAKVEAVARFVLPSMTRRIVIAVVYALAGIIATSAVTYTLFPQCMDEPAPATPCRAVDNASGSVIVIIVVAAIVAGLKGNLPGARKRPIAPGWKGQIS